MTDNRGAGGAEIEVVEGDASMIAGVGVSRRGWTLMTTTRGRPREAIRPHTEA